MSSLKWVGGKRQLIHILESKFPKKIRNFYEPFGGSLTVTLYVLENLEVDKIFVSDINSKLINFYNCIKENVENIIENSKKYIEIEYYQCRELFNSTNDKYIQASLFFILNKRCFNGVYRVNKKGFFNVPIGKNSINWENNFEKLRKFSQKISSNKITIENLNYKDFFEKYNFTKDDLIYVDPPYYNTFVSYDGYGFSDDDQKKLYDLCSNASCLVIASNSNTDFIKDLYKKKFEIEEVNAFRFVNRNSKDRTKKPVEVICVKPV